jgi:hypothetical protein
MMDLNKFELRAAAVDLDGDDYDRRFQFWKEVENRQAIDLQVWIDEKRFAAGVAVNLPSLLIGMYYPKEGYYSTMFTCGCGEPACSQITENVTVAHDGAYIIWTYDRQLFCEGFEDDDSIGIVRFRFLRSQMIEQAEAAIAIMRELSGGNFDEWRMPAYDEPIGSVMRRIVNNWHST